MFYLGILLRPTKNAFTGEIVDFLTGDVTPFFLDSLGDDTSGDHTVLHGADTNYSFGTDTPYASYNIVCQMTPQISGKSNFGQNFD